MHSCAWLDGFTHFTWKIVFNAYAYALQIMALLADALVEIQEQVGTGDNEVVNEFPRLLGNVINIKL